MATTSISASRTPTPDAIRQLRIKVVIGDATWGPAFVGPIGPFQRGGWVARLLTESDASNTEGFVRFVDTNGEAWVARARGGVEPDERSVDEWIEEGRPFAERQAAGLLTPEEVGTPGEALAQLPDSEGWRAGFENDEPQVSDPLGARVTGSGTSPWRATVER